MLLYQSNLAQELNDATDTKWDDQHLKIKAALDVATVLSVMHRNGVAHMAVRPKNVLIEYSPSDQFKQRPKMVLSDFGTARIINGSKMIGKQNAASGNYAESDATDVFDFGMTMFHIFTRRAPLAEYDEGEKAKRLCDGRYLDDIKVVAMDASVMAMVLSCVSMAPQSRSKMVQIKSSLEHLLQK